MRERHVLALILNINQSRVPLIEGSTASVLPAEPYRDAVLQQRSKRESLRHPIIQRTLAAAHLFALLQQLLDLGMNMEILRIRSERFGQRINVGLRDAGTHVVLRFPGSPEVG